MRKQIIKSLFVIGLVAVSVTTAATQALWTDTVTVQNNTFTTGSSELKIYYDNSLVGCEDNDLSHRYDVVTNLSDPTNGTGYMVECSVLANERTALTYGLNEAPATEIFDVENNWFDGLSSPIDFTNTYPAWATIGTGYDPDNSIESTSHPTPTGTYIPAIVDGNKLSLVNAGTVPMDIEMVVTREGYDVMPVEDLEPIDGTWPFGGDHQDPLHDVDWLGTAGVVYDDGTSGEDLATMIYVAVDWVDHDEISGTRLYAGSLAYLMANPLEIATDVAANNVVFLKFNWEVDQDLVDQSEMLDFVVQFNSTT